MPPDLETERRNLIALELRALGICANDPFSQFGRLVDACYRVMTAKPHENRLPSTGVVLFSHPFKQYQFKGDGEFRRVEKEDICWRLADGINSFVAKDFDGVGLLLLKEPVLDELSLFTLRDDILFDDEAGPSDPPRRECLVIQRSEGHSTRRVTILARESIVNYSGLTYISKPYQYHILQALRKSIDPFPWGDDCIQTLKSALRLAVHKLSPENHGATFLILSPKDSLVYKRLVAERHLIVDNAIKPAKCSLTERVDQRPLAHLMGQMDGATTISHTGEVLNVGAFFPSVGADDSGRETTDQHGARHRSAAEFTKEIDGIAIVISSDGPVTVFRKGAALPIPTIDN